MIGLATNVLVRFILQDDPVEARAAERLIRAHCTSSDPGVISQIVLCELVWVLSRGYKYSRTAVSTVIRRILVTRELRVEANELARQALEEFERGNADFADYLIAVSNRAQQAHITYTFDRSAIQSGLFRLVPPR